MPEYVATLNMRNTKHPFVVTPAMAEAGLRRTLAAPAGDQLVDLVGLQEWAGGARNRILRKLGPATFFPTFRRLLRRAERKATSGYGWARPALGGPWVGYRAARYVPLFVRSKTLAPAGRLERVPGFRSLLGASKVTVAGFHDLEEDRDTVVVNGHLTRHVQKGRGYRKNLPKTVARHKRERRALGRVIGYHEKRGRRVYVTVDGNYDGLELEGLVPCWQGHPLPETGGTLGNSRRVDIIFGPDEAREVLVIPTASDHDAVVAGY
jgi:hypothetical protein